MINEKRYPHKEVTGRIIAAGIEVHRSLGPGLLESAYQECLAFELRARGVVIEQQIEVPLNYRGHRLNCGYKLDLLVEDKVIVELKSVEEIHPIHKAQLITYLRLTGKQVGLLMNFNVPRLRDGIVRRIL